jgi:predicted nucleotidyltransferase
MGKRSKLYMDRKSLILDCIKNKKNIKEEVVVSFMQEELHEILYSYINGGFSNKGFVFYPLVKDLSRKNINKIDDLRIIAAFLSKNGHNFNNTLSIFENNKPNGKTAPAFISAFYMDFSNIKKAKAKKKEIKSNKLDFNKFEKKDMEYLRPVSELNRFALKELKEYLLEFYVHGSIATRDYIKGWSDLDTLIIINKNTLNDPKKLAKLRDLLYKSKKYFYKIDALHHHGHMVITEYDLEYYCETFFPLELFKFSKSIFGERYINFKIRKNKIENIERFYSFVNYFKNLYLNKKFNMGSYELKFFFHAVTLFPTMYLQAKGINVYKKFSFDLAKKDFGKKLWKPIGTVEMIRRRWKTPHKIRFVNLISSVNPLLAYQLNSKYWDMFHNISRLNDINIEELAAEMHALASNAWDKIKV